MSSIHDAARSLDPLAGDVANRDHQRVRIRRKEIVEVSPQLPRRGERGRDLGSFVAEAEEAMRQVSIPPGYWTAWGGQYENLASATERLQVVVRPDTTVTAQARHLSFFTLAQP